MVIKVHIVMQSHLLELSQDINSSKYVSMLRCCVFSTTDLSSCRAISRCGLQRIPNSSLCLRSSVCKVTKRDLFSSLCPVKFYNIMDFSDVADGIQSAGHLWEWPVYLDRPQGIGSLRVSRQCSGVAPGCCGFRVAWPSLIVRTLTHQ